MAIMAQVGADPRKSIRRWPPHPVLLWTLAPSSEEKKISLNFPSFCDYFVKKIVSEIEKCHQPRGDLVPLTPEHYILAQTWLHARHVV